MYARIFFFFFNDTATTEIYTLSLHDALPISIPRPGVPGPRRPDPAGHGGALEQWPCFGERARQAASHVASGGRSRSEEHTSELQSRQYLVCRLLLEKKTTNISCQ